MKSNSSTDIDVTLIAGTCGLTLLALPLAMEIRKVVPLGRVLEPGAERIPFALYPIAALIWLFLFFTLVQPRSIRRGRTIDVLGRTVMLVGLGSLAFAGTLFLSFRDVSRLFFIYFSLVDLLLLIGFYLTIRSMVRSQLRPERLSTRVLIVGTGEAAQRVVAALQVDPQTEVLGLLTTNPHEIGERVAGQHVLGSAPEAEGLIARHRIDEVIVALPLEEHTRLVDLVHRLQTTPVFIRVVPDFLGFAVIGGSVEYLNGLPLVGLRVPALTDQDRLLKRIFDIVVSAILLLVFSPIMALIAVAIRRDSRGPILYRSPRIGEQGRPFQMLKFRTMVEDAEQLFDRVALRQDDGALHYKSPADPRITRIGRWLRRTSLDELPQLWNVFRGQMSMVGPRPELPNIVAQEYEPWQWSRFTVPQGMTGWWQINRRGFAHQHLCTADDLYYIQHYSLLLDIQILFRTIGVVLSGRGAY
jgi:exopolysaccharide biosynthesis polyprenyl glycosylphosphotransferase